MANPAIEASTAQPSSTVGKRPQSAVAKKSRAAIAILVAIGVLSLLPLLAAALFDHPSADDFSYSDLTHLAAQTGSLADVLHAAAATSLEYMQTWQGLYSSAFALALNPAIFGEDWYAITCPLLMAVSAVAFLAFMRALCTNILGSPSKAWVGGALLAWLFFIQTMPSPVQGLYWYNGAMNYLFFWSLGLATLAIMASYYASSGAKSICLTLLAAILAFIVAGGNHVSTFACIMGLAFVAIIDIYKHRRFLALVPLAACIAGFAIVMTAPGTAVRAARLAAEAGVQNSIPWTLAMAPVTLLSCLAEWVNLQYLCFLALLMPVFHRICLAGYANTALLTLRNAVLLTIAACAFLMGMLCVPLYSLQSMGEARIANIVYATFTVLSVFIAFVYFGALQEKGCIPAQFENALSLRPQGPAAASAVVLVVMLLAPSTFTQAFDQLRTGQLQAYDSQLDARVALYEDASVSNVETPELSVKPSLIYFDDITDDPSDWRNVDLAAYYNKESVKLVPLLDEG